MNSVIKVTTLVPFVYLLIMMFMSVQYSCMSTSSQNDIESNSGKNKAEDSEGELIENVKVFAYPNGDVKSNLLFRKKPTKNSEVLSKIPIDSAIGIIKKMEICETIENIQSCWYQAKYHDTLGYVYGGYLWFRTLADLNVVDPPREEYKASDDHTNQNEHSNKSDDNIRQFKATAHIGYWHYSNGYNEEEMLRIFTDGRFSLNNSNFGLNYGTWEGDATKLSLKSWPVEGSGSVENEGKTLKIYWSALSRPRIYSRLAN